MIIASLPVLPLKTVECQLCSFSVMKIFCRSDPRFIQSCLIHDTPGERSLAKSLREQVDGRNADFSWVSEARSEIRNIFEMGHLSLEHVLMFGVLIRVSVVFFRSPPSLCFYCCCWLTLNMKCCIMSPF